jgi:hypothetical protein
VDAGGPKQGRWQEKDRKGGERIAGKPVAYGSEKGDGTQEDREGEEQGIDIQMIERKKVEDHLDIYQTVMTEVCPCRIIGEERVEIRDEPVAVHEAFPEIIPDVAMSGIEPVSNNIMCETGKDMKGE